MDHKQILFTIISPMGEVLEWDIFKLEYQLKDVIDMTPLDLHYNIMHLQDAYDRGDDDRIYYYLSNLELASYAPFEFYIQ